MIVCPNHVQVFWTENQKWKLEIEENTCMLGLAFRRDKIDSREIELTLTCLVALR
jgi:hypothetical protein